jgi:hypothetical protein
LEILDKNSNLLRRVSSRTQAETEAEQPEEWPDRVPEVKTIPAEPGMNRYVWNLRYQDPEQIPGAFYSDTGPRGPLVAPGDYQVRLTMDGVHQTVPLHVAVDPRQHAPEEALTKQLALELEVRDRITQLHRAVNEIRDLRSQIDSLHHRFANNQEMHQALDVTKDLKEKISAVEGQLIQVNMKGSEANLAFPNMLNEELDTFSHTIEQADAGPTASQYDVFRMLSAKLDEQLGTWAHIQKDELPAVNNLVRASQIPVLTVQDGESEAASGK